MQMRPINTLVIGTLYFNKTLWQFERNLQRMIRHAMENAGLANLHVVTQDGTAVDMARYSVVNEALIVHNADAVVWLDTDMIYPDYAITRLVQLSNAGHPIAAGLYRRARQQKQLLSELKWNTIATLEEIRAAAMPDGLTRVEMSAGGFSIVRNEVYQAVKLPWYANWHNELGMIGEDRYFIHQARAAGFPVVVDPELHAVHWPPQTGPVPVLPGDPLMRLCE